MGTNSFSNNNAVFLFGVVDNDLTTLVIIMIKIKEKRSRWNEDNNNKIIKKDNL